MSNAQHPPAPRHSEIFISHASEDKVRVARPLASALRRRGFSVWFDEHSLRLGDSLKRKIDEGLTACDYGVVILSTHFFAKQWPKEELDGLVTREISSKRKIVLPVWHEIDHAVVAAFSPTLAGKVGVSTKVGISKLAHCIATAIKAEAEQRGVHEVRLRSPYGGELFIKGRENAQGTLRAIDRKGIETIARQAAKSFSHLIQKVEKSPKK